jgi:hypothetical protein
MRHNVAKLTMPAGCCKGGLIDRNGLPWDGRKISFTRSIGFVPASKRAPMLSSLKKLETSIADFRLKTVMIAADL